MGCASSNTLETRTTAEVKRKPDGVLLEPAPAIPTALEHAQARGVVALKPPVSIEDVRVVVKELMRAFGTRQADVVGTLLVDDAIDLFAHYAKAQIVQNWRARMQRLDYTKIQGLEVAHVDRAELREYEDLQSTGTNARPAEMQPGDLIVRMPMTAPLINGERLFEDVMVLMLRRDGKGSLRIAGIGETN